MHRMITDGDGGSGWDTQHVNKVATGVMGVAATLHPAPHGPEWHVDHHAEPDPFASAVLTLTLAGIAAARFRL